MKKIQNLLSLCIVMLLGFSCNNDVIPDPLAKGSKRNLRDGITLDEVTVTAFRNQTNYTQNDFQEVYKLFVANDYALKADPLQILEEQYLGENVDEIPGIIDKLLTKLNTLLGAHHIQGFNQSELAILRTLSVKEIFRVYTSIVSAANLADVAMNSEFHDVVDEGYSNAFRHIYLAIGYARAVGINNAKQLMEAHEDGATDINSQMDRNNNAYAFYLLENNYINGYITFGYLLGLAQNGKLWIIKNGSLGQYPYVRPPSNNTPQN